MKWFSIVNKNGLFLYLKRLPTSPVDWLRRWHELSQISIELRGGCWNEENKFFKVRSRWQRNSVWKSGTSIPSNELNNITTWIWSKFTEPHCCVSISRCQVSTKAACGRLRGIQLARRKAEGKLKQEPSRRTINLKRQMMKLLSGLSLNIINWNIWTVRVAHCYTLTLSDLIQS